MYAETCTDTFKRNRMSPYKDARMHSRTYAYIRKYACIQAGERASAHANARVHKCIIKLVV